MDVDMYERAVTRTGTYVSGTKQEQLENPTPCSEWNVRALLNHLIAGMHSFSAATEGETVPFDADVDHAADDHVVSFNAAAEAAIAGFRKPGVLERNLPLPWGDSPGRMALGLALADAAVHGWDLAKATGQPADIDEDIAQALIAMTEMMEPKGSFPRGESFGPPIDVPEDASAQDRLLGYLGRRP